MLQNQIPEENTFDIFELETILLILVLILLGLVLFCFFKIQKFNKYEARLNRHREAIGYDTSGESLDSRILKLERSIEYLKKTKAENFKKVESIYDHNLDSNEKSDPLEEAPIQKQTNTETFSSQNQIKEENDEVSQPINLYDKEDSHSELYLKAPDREKAFYAPEATKSPDSDSVYIWKNDKYLILYPDMKISTINSIMASTDIYIKRACQIINAKESHHTRFEMVEPGEVIQEEDDLIVTKKLKIKYI